MERKNFEFKNYIIRKGFKKVSETNFVYKLSKDNELKLYIERGDYIIPVSLDLRFREEIPQNEKQADNQFKTIGEVLEISFENKSVT